MANVPVKLNTSIAGLRGPVPLPGEIDKREAWSVDHGTVVELPEEEAERLCSNPPDEPQASYLAGDELAAWEAERGVPAKPARGQRRVVGASESR